MIESVHDETIATGEYDADRSVFFSTFLKFKPKICITAPAQQHATGFAVYPASL